MGSLFEELEAREAAARTQVEVLEAELAEVSGRLSAVREGLERLRIARETVAEVLAEMTPEKPGVAVDGELGAFRRPAAQPARQTPRRGRAATSYR
ncbi:hypothetical protein [Streptomyces mirabilis]|uniref:hypothetical protein n=1 Tax=Streptomyces mirabilis TaxID=68239 RepID=UPI0036DB0F2F